MKLSRITNSMLNDSLLQTFMFEWHWNGSIVSLKISFAWWDHLMSTSVCRSAFMIFVAAAVLLRVGCMNVINTWPTIQMSFISKLHVQPIEIRGRTFFTEIVLNSQLALSVFLLLANKYVWHSFDINVCKNCAPFGVSLLILSLYITIRSRGHSKDFIRKFDDKKSIFISFVYSGIWFIAPLHEHITFILHLFIHIFTLSAFVTLKMQWMKCIQWRIHLLIEQFHAYTRSHPYTHTAFSMEQNSIELCRCCCRITIAIARIEPFIFVHSWKCERKNHKSHWFEWRWCT